MRELKFRAWGKPRWEDDPKENRMYYNIQNSYDTMGDVEPYDIKDSFNSWLQDKSFIVEQYTGLKDNNDTEIYEGDIIEVETCIDEEEITTYEVYWDEGSLEYALRTIKGINYDSCVGELSQSATKVIGNIHENPELLGGEE